MKPGESLTSTGVLSRWRYEGVDGFEGGLGGLQAADDFPTSFITGTKLKKCKADDLGGASGGGG